MPESQEHPLTGGNVGSGIVRVGDTVRRPAGPGSAGVDALLLHLEAVGFPNAPRALGYDEFGRQVLTYVDGAVDADPSDLAPAALARVGAVIRGFHDAVDGFAPPSGVAWNVAIPPDREELIAHHDLGPWNLVRGRELTIIDWDGAGPGSRLWDLAYAAHGFAPLSTRADNDDAGAAARLAALVDGYGLDEVGRLALLDLLVVRIRSMYDLLRCGHRDGREPWNRLWIEGHGAIWSADAAYAERLGPTLRAALLS